jgi:phosphoglycerate dehydrogenase-like enzyme
VADGHWSAAGQWCAPLAGITGLHGLCLGIIGRGRIARRVADIGRAFGMRVMMASPSLPAGGDGLDALDAVVAGADILSLHCQLTPSNARMVNAEFLHGMKAHAFLVNTARGGLVDENALACALRTGVSAGAVQDQRKVGRREAAPHPSGLAGQESDLPQWKQGARRIVLSLPKSERNDRFLKRISMVGGQHIR